MRKLFVTLTILLIVGIARGKDIFGEDREFSLVFGNDFSVISYKFVPTDQIRHGPVIELSLDELYNDHQKINDTFVGYGIEYAFASVDSLIRILPIDGKAYLFGRCLYDTSTDNNFLVSWGPGVDIEVSKKEDYTLNTRVEYRRLEDPDDIINSDLVCIGMSVLF